MKLCVYCDNPHLLIKQEAKNYYYIECYTCKWRGDHGTTSEHAIDNWIMSNLREEVRENTRRTLEMFNGYINKDNG